MAPEPKAIEEMAPPTAVVSNNHPNSPIAAEQMQDLESKPVRTGAQTALIMLSLCGSVFLAALDITIISTALPTIAEHFHSTVAFTWVGSAYMLANASGTPIWGKLSDIWGRKPLLLVVTVIFFIGSAICGSAVSMNMLIAGRTIQGLGAGGLLTLANIVVSDLFSMRERPKYYGLVGMTWALASAIGPVLGGVLTQKASWRWCFYINLPITGLAFFILLFVLKLYTPKTPVLAGLAAVDWLGAITIVGATVMLLLGLTLGGVSRPWDSPTVLCLLIFGILLFVIFGFIEWRFAKYPIMPVSIFQNTSNVASFMACFFHGSVMILVTFFLPLYFQSVLSASVILSGVWVLPLCLSMSLASMMTGWYISTSGSYLALIRLAFAFTSLGIGLLSALPHSRSWAELIIYQVFIGIGIGPNFQALLVAIQNQVQPKDYSTATATFGFVRNLSTSISIVVGNVVFQNSIQKKQGNLSTVLSPQEIGLFSGKAAEASVFLVRKLSAAQQVVVKDAFYSSLRDVWILAVALAAMGLMASALIKGKELSKVHEEVNTGLNKEEGSSEKVGAGESV